MTIKDYILEFPSPFGVLVLKFLTPMDIHLILIQSFRPLSGCSFLNYDVYRSLLHLLCFRPLSGCSFLNDSTD